MYSLNNCQGYSQCIANAEVTNEDGKHSAASADLHFKKDGVATKGKHDCAQSVEGAEYLQRFAFPAQLIARPLRPCCH